MKKFTPHYEWIKSANEAWGSTIYFVNEETLSLKMITVYGAPDMSGRKAKSRAKELLELRAEEFLIDHPGYRQVNYGEYEMFYDKKRALMDY